MEILIIESDETMQLLLQKILSSYPLTIVETGEAAFEHTSNTTPDLVILEINLSTMDGYDVCKQLRSSGLDTTPIIFLSSRTVLEDRLKAYDAGANDFISKPFDVKEFTNKVEQNLRLASNQKKLKQELMSSHQLLKGMQISSSKLQSISRFIQATLFVHDIDALGECFFKIAAEIGLDCVLKIDSASGTRILSSDGKVNTLEEEILCMASNADRILPFGRDRAIYHWKKAILLTRNVGEMIDTIAIFMDALDACIKSIDAEQQLLEQVCELESKNSSVQQKVDELFSNMNQQIKDTILSLGLISALDVDDEEKLNHIVDSFSASILKQFGSIKQINQTIRQLITDKLMNSEKNILLEDVHGIEMF